ncbi:uncharacterized protein SCHCODRAFT_02668813 [Schizophyllum commune H4-8]|nr:uncharacterized protein SCHCODRAFT_02668813 [Schizophyllum commune H4-8]KAI5891468.1 hypothetical protein SCHCODRAFT_02668813 [Schizophyllum commune H4-8]
MLANTSQTDPARRVSNINIGYNFAMLYKPRCDSQAPPPSTFWQPSAIAPLNRPRGPFSLAYRPKSSDFLPISQARSFANDDDLRSTNTNGIRSTTANGPHSNKTSGVRWKIHALPGAESIDAPLTDAPVSWQNASSSCAEGCERFIIASGCGKPTTVAQSTGERLSRGLKRSSGRDNRSKRREIRRTTEGCTGQRAHGDVHKLEKRRPCLPTTLLACDTHAAVAIVPPQEIFADVQRLILSYEEAS